MTISEVRMDLRVVLHLARCIVHCYYCSIGARMLQCLKELHLLTLKERHALDLVHKPGSLFELQAGNLDHSQHMIEVRLMPFREVRRVLQALKQHANAIHVLLQLGCNASHCGFL